MRQKTPLLLLDPARRGRTLGSIALLAAVPLAAGYFFFGDSIRDTQAMVSMFYPSLRPGWAVLREAEIHYAFQGNADLWTTLVVRTAYGRWRLRSLAPEPFENLMNDYSRGWWIAPSREVWIRTFESTDTKWITQRKQALSETEGGFAPPETAVEKPNPNELVLRFPGNPRTAEVGSIVRVIVDAAPEDAPTGPPRVYWETERAPGVSAARRRLALWMPIEGAPEGKQRFSLETDMSWEPAWMDPGAVARALHFRGKGVGKWEVVRREFDDSPLLNVPKEHP